MKKKSEKHTKREKRELVISESYKSLLVILGIIATGFTILNELLELINNLFK